MLDIGILSMTENPSARALAEDAISRLHDYDSLSALAASLHKEHPESFATFESARTALRRARGITATRASIGAATSEDTGLHGFDKRLPEGFAIKGVSAYFDGEGNPGGVWIKTAADRVRQLEIIRESFDALSAQLPRVKPTKAPAAPASAENLCNLYIVTDAHLGVMASIGESGAAYGLEEGEHLYSRAMDALIEGSPKARRCVIAQLGDFLHSDGLESVTPRSKHPLDQSARFHEMVRSSVRLLRAMVIKALAHHEDVEVIIAEGNHDPASSVWLRVAFAEIFADEPRVIVVDEDLPFYETTHGDVMLGFHHGHIKNIKNNAKDLALLFASGDAWRATQKRYIHTGHHHDEALVEVSGAKLYGHPTLAAPDAYASRNYGGSCREVSSHTYHDKHGKVATMTITPEMLS